MPNYKLYENSILDLNSNTFIPFREGNISYQKFINDIKEHGLSIVEGADVIEPDYVALRTRPDGYASLSDQLDMQFKNDGSWEKHVQEVKDKYPKTNKGKTTIAPLPQWVLDLAGELTIEPADSE